MFAAYSIEPVTLKAEWRVVPHDEPQCDKELLLLAESETIIPGNSIKELLEGIVRTMPPAPSGFAYGVDMPYYRPVSMGLSEDHFKVFSVIDDLEAIKTEVENSAEPRFVLARFAREVADRLSGYKYAYDFNNGMLGLSYGPYVYPVGVELSPDVSGDNQIHIIECIYSPKTVKRVISARKRTKTRGKNKALFPMEDLATWYRFIKKAVTKAVPGLWNLLAHDHCFPGGTRIRLINQVLGLMSILKTVAPKYYKDKEYKPILLTLDPFCHGNPTDPLLKEMVKFILEELQLFEKKKK